MYENHRQNIAALHWTVRPVGDLSQLPNGFSSRPIRANVPGCIHTDLIDAGLIRDPRIGDAEAEVQWVSWTDWRYEASFEADDELFRHEEIELVFDHLDTIATVELNGVEVGRANSEFLPWRFRVNDVLRKGTNHVSVTFTSPLRYVKEEAARLSSRPVNGDYPAYNMIRKCASNFEWDWGPRVATCGIADGARLEAWSGVRISSVAPRVTPCGDNRWKLHVRCELVPSAASAGAPYYVTAAIDGPAPTALADIVLDHTTEVELQFDELDGMHRWHPLGHGDQPAYKLTVNVVPAEKRGGHAQATTSVAFRSCELLTECGSFTLTINGRSVYCRGANWIPEGLFPRDRTPERVRERLMQLKAANMNMIRVWGGGRYEPDWFYDICDELGIMVWQDFMFACACYPEEEPIWSLVEEEARHHVDRLSRHPSVVLWCGGNECTWAHLSWGFKEKLAPGQTWGEKYYYALLKRVCDERGVSYIPNSPFSLDRARHPNDPTEGDTHVWEVWGDGYRTVTPRFCSEFGQQGPSCTETLANAGLTPPDGSEDMVPPLLVVRQRGPGGNKRWYEDPIAMWFRPPRDFDEWHYLAQLLQARSLQIGIEWQRANMPHCMGSLIWQLNDAWPGLSWSLIDADGRPKLAYDAVAAAFMDRKLTIQPIDGALHVVAINDTGEQWTSRLRVRRMSFDGSLCVEPETNPFSIAPRCAERICRVEELVGTPINPDFEFVVAESPEHRAMWFYLPDRELRYPSPLIQAELRHDRFGFEDSLTINSDVLLRDVVIRTERLHPGLRILQPPLLSVLPGETLHFDISAKSVPEIAPHLTAEKLTSRPIFWCANHFGKPPTPNA